MSSEEKHAWIAALVGFAVPVAYLATVMSKVPGADVAKIAYVWPMLASIGGGIGAGIVVAIVAAMASPKGRTGPTSAIGRSIGGVSTSGSTS